MAEPKSLSVRELTAATKSSVARVVDQQRGKLLKPPYVLGFFPPIWCGFVIRDIDRDKLTFREAAKIAAEVHKGIAAEVPGAKGGKPGALIQDGFTTIGFAPPIDTLIQL
jgi:hypothetical protein